MKFTVLFGRAEGLQLALGQDAYPEGVHVAVVEGDDLHHAVAQAAAQLGALDGQRLERLGYDLESAGEVREEAYELLAVFEGHPKLAQHGGVNMTASLHLATLGVR